MSRPVYTFQNGYASPVRKLEESPPENSFKQVLMQYKPLIEQKQRLMESIETINNNGEDRNTTHQ